MIKNVFHPYCESCPDIKVEADTTVNEVYSNMINLFTGDKEIISKNVETVITCRHYNRCQNMHDYIANKTKGEQK